tara:strand:- start:98 stop:1030 length:933 start_codon:yes stop_codon:yes gene_type:complete
MLEIAVLIVTYNGEEYISDCIGSLLGHFNQDEIYIVDNCSSDDTIEILESSFPSINIIKNPENSGFGTACNLGTQSIDCDLVMFLNQDAKLISFDKKAIRSIFQSGKIGVLGGKVVGISGQAIDSVGKELSVTRILGHWIGLPFQFLGMSYFGLVKNIDQETNFLPDIPWINGHLMVINKSLFSDLGGFDERFFMYVEEADLCFRVRESGFKVSYSSDIASIDYNSVRNNEGGVSRLVIHNSLLGHGLYVSKDRGILIGILVRTICSLFSIMWGIVSAPFLIFSSSGRKSSISLISGGLIALFGLKNSTK